MSEKATWVPANITRVARRQNVPIWQVKSLEYHQDYDTFGIDSNGYRVCIPIIPLHATLHLHDGSTVLIEGRDLFTDAQLSTMGPVLVERTAYLE